MARDKKEAKIIKLQVSAGQAAPTPPIGPILGQHGVNIPEFCKQFNAKSKDMEPGMPVPVIITLQPNKTFTFEIKTPPTSFLLRKAAGLQIGSREPGHDMVGKVTAAQVEEIAKQKMEDMGIDSLDSAIMSVKGTARSMGVKVGG